jgi:small conductance mechanosensitive channel
MIGLISQLISQPPARRPVGPPPSWRLQRLLLDVTILAQVQPAPSVEGFVGSFKHFSDKFIEHLPYLLAAAVFLALTVILARLVRRGVEAALRRTSTEAYVHLLVAKLAYFGTMLLGLVVALSIGGVQLGWVVGSLGLVTIALGFALQDILSNFVAGIVLLLEHPFTRGDQIAMEGVAGKVEDIRVRATQLRTADGQQVLIPNKLLFTSVIINSTATMHRRIDVTVSVPGAEVSDKLREQLLAAVAGVDGVSGELDKQPRLLVQDLGDDRLELLLQVWIDPRRRPELEQVRSEVLEAAHAVLARSNMGLTGSKSGSRPSDEKKAG